VNGYFYAVIFLGLASGWSPVYYGWAYSQRSVQRRTADLAYDRQTIKRTIRI